MSPCRLWKESLALAEDYIDLCCTADPGAAPPPPGEAAATMRRVGRHAESLNEASFHSLAQTFLRSCGPDLSYSFRRVMEEMVSDGLLNWGRVVSLFAFTGVLARMLREQREKAPSDATKTKGLDLDTWPQICRKLAETIADFLGEEKKEWMLENNGWEGFCKWCVRHSGQDLSMKTALLAAAGVGLAGLTFLLGR
ncbi:bcl-2-like protein 10 [Corythoichthys intestinalis]|uniref:bcl-2-like protein 10 n=1 Tax=Corythoichthys intestinalis TaxID=161448 RepID=UPI0025A4D055|nr:bcl-2-like protein 10 [Corythoichthys intestinalis]XP_061795921.1 anti-apoptotic protein NR13-like [Nerophis lumbriciformis]